MQSLCQRVSGRGYFEAAGDIFDDDWYTRGEALDCDGFEGVIVPNTSKMWYISYM